MAIYAVAHIGAVQIRIDGERVFAMLAVYFSKGERLAGLSNIRAESEFFDPANR